MQNQKGSTMVEGMRNQKGFTMIELIIVIVIIGLLAAVAIPKFLDLRTDAAVANANGVYGGAQGAAAINFAANVMGRGLTPITTGATLIGAMDSAPAGWTAAGTVISAPLSGTTYTIRVLTTEAATHKAVLGSSW